MKLTIFGLTLSSSWGNGHATPYRALIRALHRQGHTVTFFEKDVNYYARRRDFSQCDYCHLVLYNSWDAVRSQALKAAADSDVIMTASYLPEGACINDELLCLPHPVKVFYDLDTPVTLNRLRKSSVGLDYVRADQMPLFDLYLSFTGGRILDELRDEWRVRYAVPLYGCVDPEVHRRVEVPEQYRCTLSYMGTYAADRQNELQELFLEPARKMATGKFVLAGSMYPAQGAGRPWPANVCHFEHVGPSDHAALYSSSQATLNITRTEMAIYGYCPSGRLFEAAACGTPVITDSWRGLQEFFSDGEEIIIAESAQDVLAALQLPQEQLAKIAHRARQRTLDEHTGDHRARQFMEAIENATASQIPSATCIDETRLEVA